MVHAHEAHAVSGGNSGKRVEYVVTGRRGATAEYRDVTGISKTYKTDAEMLAFRLGISEAELVGSGFSCWVAPAEYGVIRSDYRLTAS